MDTQLLSTALSLLLLQRLHIGAAVTHDDGWSVKVPPEVRAVEGYPVVLPCSFTHPKHTQHSSMRVIWRMGHGHSATVLLQCSSLNGSQQCHAQVDQDQRYRLEGNPREHDLSLRFNSAALQDSGRYYCRVELLGHDHAGFENKMGTRLRVEAAPRILGLSVEGSEDAGYTALCHVRGSPLPDIRWIGLLEADVASPLSQEVPGQFHTSLQLKDAQPGGQYTCIAANPLGKDQATLYIISPGPDRGYSASYLLLLLSLSLGGKMVLSLAMWAWMASGSLKVWPSSLTQ